jgi:Uma2 family endonuclease
MLTQPTRRPDEEHVMIAVVDEPREHLLLSNVSWETYERLLDDIGASHYRLTFDEGELEIMTLSFGHENVGRWIGRLIFFLALELNQPLCSGGSTTLKQGLRKKGLEPDECFWIEHEHQMRGKKEWNALTDPPPDLGVEIDITRSSLDRLGIYAALRVPEIWRYDGHALKVLVLGANGKYRARSKSAAFPLLPLGGFAQFVAKLGSANEVRLIREFTDWLRTEVVTKKPGAARKNGRE